MRVSFGGAERGNFPAEACVALAALMAAPGAASAADPRIVTEDTRLKVGESGAAIFVRNKHLDTLTSRTGR